MAHRTHDCILFDLDGTLCDTSDVDDCCYREAVATSLGIRADEVHWTDAPHRTDAGIAMWLWDKHRGRPPRPEEMDDLRREFVNLLERERDTAPHRFAAIGGAARFIKVCQEAGLRTGIGTGGWRASATLKLEAAGLPIPLLLATSDDGISRVEIFSLAMDRTSAPGEASSVLFFGDSDCDAATARQLGWEFVGIGSGDHAIGLREQGAFRVIRDYSDADLHDLIGHAWPDR